MHQFFHISIIHFTILQKILWNIAHFDCVIISTMISEISYVRKYFSILIDVINVSDSHDVYDVVISNKNAASLRPIKIRIYRLNEMIRTFCIRIARGHSHHLIYTIILMCYLTQWWNYALKMRSDIKNKFWFFSNSLQPWKNMFWRYKS